MANLYDPPKAPLDSPSEIQYVGFWVRVLATFIDSILILGVTLPPLYLIYGTDYFLGDTFIHGIWDIVFSYILPSAAILLFWRYKSATPGKIALRAKIVDAKTGLKPSTGQLIGRYFAYIPSTLVLFIGYLWIAWDPKKQAWHDKLANTLVVKNVR